MKAVIGQAVLLSASGAGSSDVTGPVGSLFSGVLALFKIECTLFGVTLSLWQVFLFSIAASITIWVLKELFLSD